MSSLPFSSFVTGAGSGADFHNVGAVEFQSNGGTAVQTQIQLVGAVGPKQLTGNDFANIAQIDLAIVKTASPAR